MPRINSTFSLDVSDIEPEPMRADTASADWPTATQLVQMPGVAPHVRDAAERYLSSRDMQALMYLRPFVPNSAPVAVRIPRPCVDPLDCPPLRIAPAFARHYDELVHDRLSWALYLLRASSDLDRTSVLTSSGYGDYAPVDFKWSVLIDRLAAIIEAGIAAREQDCPNITVSWTLLTAAKRCENNGITHAFNLPSVMMDACYSLEHLDHAFPAWESLRRRCEFPGIVRHDTNTSENMNGGMVLRYFDMPYAEREQLRFDTGCYMPVPWHNAGSYEVPAQLPRGDKPGREAYTVQLPALTPIEGHYVHTNPSDGSQVRYTENADKGARHIYVVSKPGRYLSKFYPHLSADDVRAWQALLDKSNSVQFATTPDECVRVYINGPGSCMGGKKSLGTTRHPAQVYGAPGDVVIAYLNGANGEPIARAVCWQEKKRYGRIYGDKDRLKPRLDAMGYEQKDIKGAKVRCVYTNKDEHTLIMPYIDCVGYATISDCGKFVVLDDGGTIEVRSTDGTAVVSGSQCCNCNDPVDRDECHSYDDGEIYCQSCHDDLFSYCDHTSEYQRGETYPVEVPRRNGSTFDTEYWCESARDSDAYYCDGSREWFSDRHPCVEMHDGSTWSLSHFQENGHEAWDGDNYPHGEGPEDRRDQNADDYEADERGTVWTTSQRTTNLAERTAQAELAI